MEVSGKVSVAFGKALRKIIFTFCNVQKNNLYEVLNLFLRWPIVFRSFLPAPLVAREVVTPNLTGSYQYDESTCVWSPNILDH